MRSGKLDGTTAARLKRMQAIRRKLRRIRLNLNQLQDLGGCRVILPSIADVHTLVSTLRDNPRHEIRDQDNYIAAPKNDGYRSHHLIYKFSGRGRSVVHDGHKVEVQIRTRLQHSWATAVEAVGLFRGEYLKGDQGSLEWLRLFKFISAEFALAERCPEPPDVPARTQRVAEIRELDRILKATNTLDNLSHAVRWTDTAMIAPEARPTHYLIRYNNLTKEVHVTPEFGAMMAVRSYDKAESADNRSGLDATNVVLVEVDKIENLKVAYPNYFGDVQLFKEQLTKITKGRVAEEYTVKPQETVAPRPKEKPDLAWFRRRIRWR